MNTPTRRSGPGTLARAGARTAKIAGALLCFSALALASTQFYSVSAATLGPGAFMLSIPKLLGGSLAPLLAVAAAIGIALTLLAVWLSRGATGRTRPSGLGAFVIILAGVAAAIMSVVHTRQVLSASGDFAQAFGADWQKQIPSALESGMLAERWTWKLTVPANVPVERDVAFATVPGTDRKLLADVWTPPAGTPPSQLAFIYLHGGGYSAFDKGGPTEGWFRHLASQGHVVMDVAYRLIPETDVPGMQGVVRRFSIVDDAIDEVRHALDPVVAPRQARQRFFDPPGGTGSKPVQGGIGCGGIAGPYHDERRYTIAGRERHDACVHRELIGR